jgi:hypothetical protein
MPFEGAAGGPPAQLVEIFRHVAEGFLRTPPGYPNRRQANALVAAGYTVERQPGARGSVRVVFVSPTGVQVNPDRAVKIARQLIRQPLPLPTPRPPDEFPTSTPPFSQVNAVDYGIAAHYGPRSRSKRKKKLKSRLRGAAAVLAGNVRAGVQTGEEIFADLLGKGRAAVRYVEPTFERLLKKAPMSDFERLLHDKPFRTPSISAVEVGEAAVSTAARAVGAAGLLLWPSSIGTESPWMPPPPKPGQPRSGPRSRGRPRPPVEPFALPQSVPAQTMPRPLPRTETLSFPAPIANRLPVPVATPAPAARSVPAPAPSPRPTPTAAPRPSLYASSFLFAPLALGLRAPRNMPRPGRRAVVWPQQSAPLTQTETAPAKSDCDCSKPTRTKRERAKRCTNPVISRSRKGDELTITRRIKCPASSRKKRA